MSSVTLGFCLTGVLLMSLGMVRLVKRFLLKRACTVQVKARLSFLPCKPGSKEQKSLKLLAQLQPQTMPREAYYEVVTYQVLGVDRVVPTGHLSLDNFRYSTGQNMVTVAYDPFKPSRHSILEKQGSLVPAVIVVVVGAIFAAIPLILEQL